MIDQIEEQYRTYAERFSAVARTHSKRSGLHFNHKSEHHATLQTPAMLDNVMSINSVGSDVAAVDPYDPSAFSKKHEAMLDYEAKTFGTNVTINGPEMDPRKLIDTLKFYPCYRGYVAGDVKSKKAAGGYSVKVQRRTAILVSADKYGVIILSQDDASLQCRFSWNELKEMHHVHTCELWTPLQKRKRTNYLALRLKDGSVYVINSFQTPELHEMIVAANQKKQ